MLYQDGKPEPHRCRKQVWVNRLEKWEEKWYQTHWSDVPCQTNWHSDPRRVLLVWFLQVCVF
ncbi:hypothetical protein AA0312_0584 [Acetobacter tropicalis NRIC 0312]|uniref:Uncharacterized protein n=1 Tax=Acetobacter tropicalis TaxID=104102 RepID=A0A511FQH5_9PROT|nr:hypothetical protein ATR1_002d0030 [Acetobacter tropicalis]GBR67757.1 hypothetical protein AA0312_0584 [Acetobacter tropicalis NRIC 0312]GEL51184.1 hypothetical protein ATR01nite_22590 [Acetobacter tropicalis]